MSRFGYVMVTYFMTMGIAIASFVEFPKTFIWNASASTPIGLYRIDHPRHLAVTDLVAVRAPEAFADFMVERGYIGRGVPLMKRVAGLPGQEVCRRDHAITVDGAPMGDALDRDHLGRPLPDWQGCRRIAGGECERDRLLLPGGLLALLRRQSSGRGLGGGFGLDVDRLHEFDEAGEERLLVGAHRGKRGVDVAHQVLVALLLVHVALVFGEGVVIAQQALGMQIADLPENGVEWIGRLTAHGFLLLAFALLQDLVLQISHSDARQLLGHLLLQVAHIIMIVLRPLGIVLIFCAFEIGHFPAALVASIILHPLGVDRARGRRQPSYKMGPQREQRG